MIKTVLITLAVVVSISLVGFWLASGGIDAVARTAKGLSSPFDFFAGKGTSTKNGFIRLPWQPESIGDAPDPSADLHKDEKARGAYGENKLAELDARTFGNPSPNVDRVVFAYHSATDSDPAKEYVVLKANDQNNAPVMISGWSLQSAVSGMRIGIPLGAPLFVLGVVNNVQPIYLEPGSSAVVTTGVSPVGATFRENVCSGYLNELQSFTPSLSSRCPASSEALPITADNLRAYGDTCVDYVRTIPSCHFPSDIPANLSATCRSFIKDVLSYNGCVRTQNGRPSFALPSWRVYLGVRTEMWSNGHDVIRLLDEKGQVVDVLTY